MRRDPNRTWPVSQKLLTLWNLYPELRLGQLLDNLAVLNDKDLFYLEDDELLVLIEDGIATYHKSKGMSREDS